MPRGEGASDFVFESPQPVDVELPPTAQVVELPKVDPEQASARSTRWVMLFMLFVLFALVVLTIVGPHIPSGE
jgi:hypothetical protein